jgi:hypothetical protein
LNGGETLDEAVVTPLPTGPKAEIPSADWRTSRCNLTRDLCYGPVPEAAFQDFHDPKVHPTPHWRS